MPFEVADAEEPMLEETRPTGNGRARGLVSSRVSGRRVGARTFAPGPGLCDAVECYWVTRWDLRDQPPHMTELLGDPCVTVAFEAGQSRVVGVSTRLWRRELTGLGLIRAAKLRAGAARAFLDGPIVRLTDRVVPFATVFSTAPAGLEQRVLTPKEDVAGFVPLERWLLTCLRRPPDPWVSLAAKVVDYIARHEHLTSVAEVAKRSGLSLRPLQRLFRDYVGASPKWVIRRHRLQEAALRLERGGVVSLADLAAELGYSDHAHLSRDFRAATGRTPSDFVKHVGKE